MTASTINRALSRTRGAVRASSPHRGRRGRHGFARAPVRTSRRRRVAEWPQQDLVSKSPAPWQQSAPLPPIGPQIAVLLRDCRYCKDQVQGWGWQRTISGRSLVCLAKGRVGPYSVREDRRRSRAGRPAVPLHVVRHRPVLRAAQGRTLNDMRRWPGTGGHGGPCETRHRRVESRPSDHHHLTLLSSSLVTHGPQQE